MKWGDWTPLTDEERSRFMSFGGMKKEPNLTIMLRDLVSLKGMQFSVVNKALAIKARDKLNELIENLENGRQQGKGS